MAENLSILEAVGSRIMPGSDSLDEAGRDRFHTLISRALDARTPIMQTQFSLFLTAVHWLPILRWGRTFESLSPENQDCFLRWLQTNPIRNLRQGFWGLKTIVCIGYYGQSELSDRFSYRPQKDGNALLDAR